MIIYIKTRVFQWSKMNDLIHGLTSPYLVYFHDQIRNLPITVWEIAQAQKDDAVLMKLSTCDKYSTQLIEDTQVLCKDGKMVIPTVLQNKAVNWYQHYL